MNIFTKLASFFNTPKPENQDPSPDSFSITVSDHLKDFLENEVLDGLDITKEHFWSSFEKIINEFSPIIPLYYDMSVRLKQKNIFGLTNNPLNILDLKTVYKKK